MIYREHNIAIVNGDCLKILPHISSNSVSLIIADPPYLKAYSTGRRKSVIRKTTEILNDRELNYYALMHEYRRVLKEDGHLYVFACWQRSDYVRHAIEQFFKIKNRLVWVKNNWTAGDLWWTYGQSYEDIWFATNGRKQLNLGRDRDCLYCPRVVGKSQLHLNQKPLRLIEFIIKKSSVPGDIVLDSFTGSGTTAIACKNLNRRCIGIELDEKYFNIAIKRLKGVI